MKIKHTKKKIIIRLHDMNIQILQRLQTGKQTENYYKKQELKSTISYT